jgi:hypothetical protein
MHDEIKKFSLEGVLGEPNIVETKQRMIDYVENMMRDYAYVPALDLEPQFTLDYVPEENGFKFQLSVYGVKVDSAEHARKTGGIMGGNEIPKYQPQRG